MSVMVNSDKTGESRKTVYGTILEIQRMSTEDGPGLRTTVFFKGCSLACSWCHNPESIKLKPEPQWVGSRCIFCGLCLEQCGEKALSVQGREILIDRRLCSACGACVRECPSGALELLGKKWQPEELAEELAKDQSFFSHSNGGVTLSGGEAVIQYEFCAELLKNLKSRGISTALDTCGEYPFEYIEPMLPFTDLLLYDIKEIDPKKHKDFTGKDNRRILENLIRIVRAKEINGNPGELWIRTPIIPGSTDREENIEGISRFISENLSGHVTRWELCAFNNLGRDKYLRLGKEWKYADTPLLPARRLEELTETARKSGADPEIILWTGTTLYNEEIGENK